MQRMRATAWELELPLDQTAAGQLARRRVEHLQGLGDLGPGAFVRLVRAFPNLRAVYAASEDELARVVGSVAAARIRWFLDAPLDTRLAVEHPETSGTTLRTAA